MSLLSGLKHVFGMPLYKTIQHNSNTQILIWDITESFDQLNQEVQLNQKNQLRLNGMKSEMHQRAFLSIRKLLALAGYTDFDLDHSLIDKYRNNFVLLYLGNTSKRRGISTEVATKWLAPNIAD